LRGYFNTLCMNQSDPNSIQEYNERLTKEIKTLDDFINSLPIKKHKEKH
jgi:hypothetical protein